MDRRTVRRHERLKLATEVAGRLNRAAAEYLAWKHEESTTPSLSYYPSDAAAHHLSQMIWVQFLGKGNGYVRRFPLSAIRPNGKRVSVYFHGNSRSFIVREQWVNQPARNAQPSLLDAFHEIGSGAVAWCIGCPAFFARRDGRQRFCTPACANRIEQRRHRARVRRASEMLEVARAAYARHEEAKAQHVPWVPPAKPERNDPADMAARRRQERDRHARRGRKDWRA